MSQWKSASAPYDTIVRMAKRQDMSTSVEQNKRKKPMNKNPLSQGMIEQNAAGIGEVSGEMIDERAKELALIAARPVTREDREQSLRELTGGNGMDEKQALLESAFEDERRDTVPGSIGHQVHEASSEDEDADGRSQSERLFEEGVSEAGHDQMLQAARAAKEKDSST